MGKVVFDILVGGPMMIITIGLLFFGETIPLDSVGSFGLADRAVVGRQSSRRESAPACQPLLERRRRSPLSLQSALEHACRRVAHIEVEIA